MKEEPGYENQHYRAIRHAISTMRLYYDVLRQKPQWLDLQSMVSKEENHNSKEGQGYEI